MKIPPRERQNCHWCQLRSFATHQTLPITIVNETDDGAVIPPSFEFIDRTILGTGVQTAEASFRSGCECADNEQCMYRGCLCLSEMIGSDEEPEDDDDDDEEDDETLQWARSVATHGYKGARGIVPATGRGGRSGRTSVGDTSAKKRFAYHSMGAKKGMLKGNILHSREPIYECHEGCKCSRDCPNRVVERGRQVPLQIFRTDEGARGWGVRAMADIKRGQFVDKYLGEIITSAEANKRRNASSMAQRKDVYLFALDKFSDPNSLDPRLAGAPLEVDGEFKSGPTRFINHSCDPNMRIFARVGDHADKHIHDLALFAIRDIPKGEELTFDYVDGLEDMENDAKDKNLQGEMTACLCGSRKCRGFLW